MKKTVDITVLGVSTVDCIGRSDTFEPYVMNPVKDLRVTCGGLGNAVSALSGLGLRLAVCSRIGQDLYGDFLLNEWHAMGVDTSGVVRDSQAATGFAYLVDHGAERTPFYAAGANARLSLADIPADLYERSRFVLIFFAGALPALDGAPMLDLVRHPDLSS